MTVLSHRSRSNHRNSSNSLGLGSEQLDTSGHSAAILSGAASGQNWFR